MIQFPHSTDPFLALANEIEGNRWWVDSSGEWELPPEENRRRGEGFMSLFSDLKAGALEEALARVAKPRRQPSIATLVKRAEKTGKTVTSITTSDGTRIDFDEPKPTDASNPWLADLSKVKR